MQQMKVELVCTTDDPTDSLEHHQTVAADDSFPVQMLPTWRPDKGMAIEDANAFNEWVDKLAECSDTEINSFDAYLSALRRRHDFFHQVGCRLSDHGIGTVDAVDYTAVEINAIFENIRCGNKCNENEIEKFKSAMLYEFGVMDAEKNWTQQFHLGALRNNNSRMFEKIGPDTGYDSIGDYEVAKPLGRLLDRLEANQSLARTIIYNLNPRDNELLATMMGNFQDGNQAGKMQFGSGWWFMDQQDGMIKQLNALSNMGLLSRFVGMLTDSRSFLSYTRHEYFRRLLCNLLGEEIKKGLLPDDIELIGGMVQDICYHNAVEYFGFQL